MKDQRPVVRLAAPLVLTACGLALLLFDPVAAAATLPLLLGAWALHRGRVAGAFALLAGALAIITLAQGGVTCPASLVAAVVAVTVFLYLLPLLWHFDAGATVLLALAAAVLGHGLAAGLLPRPSAPPHRVAAPPASLAAGCKEKKPTSTPAPSPAPTADRAIPERFTIAAGQRYGSGSFALTARDIVAPDGHGARGYAALVPSDHQNVIALQQGECIRGSSHLYVLESVDAPSAAPAVGRFVRVVLTAPRPAREGVPLELSPRDTARTADGWTIAVSRVSPAGLEVGLPLVDIERGSTKRTLSLAPRANQDRVTHLDATRVLAVQLTPARDPLGCAVVRLTIERHDDELVEVASGQEVHLVTDHSARLGKLVVRFDSWGEYLNAPTAAPQRHDYTFALLVLEANGEQVVRQCFAGGDACSYAGYSIRVHGAAPGEAQVSISKP